MEIHEVPNGVICYWEWVKPKTNAPYETCWKFVEAYGVDLDGYAISPVKNKGNERSSRCEWRNWVEKRADDDDNNEQIPGRVVTAWSFANGVYILEFTCPEKIPDWVGFRFFDEVIKSKKCWDFIRDGFSLYGGTLKVIDELNRNGWKTYPDKI